MVVRESARNVLANQGHYFNASYPQERYTPSGPDHAQTAACHGISQYLDALIEHHFGDSNHPQQHQRDLKTLIHKHEACLMAPLLSFSPNDRTWATSASWAQGLLQEEHPVSAIIGRSLRQSCCGARSRAASESDLAPSLATDFSRH